MAFRLEEPLRAYRIADSRRKVFDGSGAATFGGRWNSPGRHVIYASETYAGALLEKLVHTSVGLIPSTQSRIEIVIPASFVVEEVKEDDLPGWGAVDQRASRAYGDDWYDRRRSAVLRVPSVVTRVERNVILNQEHPDFPKIKAGKQQPVVWDRRLLHR